MKKMICMGFAVCFAVVMTGCMLHGHKLQKGIAEEVFRFHVLANSDSKEDQELKLQVRDEILSYMKMQLSPESDKEETKKWTKEHLHELNEVAKTYIKKAGYEYAVETKVEKVWFPEKQYGDLVFPAGKYEALRILIGEAKGKNWWCVLYPNLCFLNSVHAVVPEDGKEEMKEVLTEEEYEHVTIGTKFKIKWYFLAFGNGSV